MRDIFTMLHLDMGQLNPRLFTHSELLIEATVSRLKRDKRGYIRACQMRPCSFTRYLATNMSEIKLKRYRGNGDSQSKTDG